MPISLAFLLALAAASTPASEEFGAFFSRVLSDVEFRQSRVAADFSAAEEITWYPEETHMQRPLHCTYLEIENAGWTIMPIPDGVEYSRPRFKDGNTAIVFLGPPESEADAEYHFKRRDGEWFLTHLTVLSRLESGDPLPPPVCTNSR